MYCEIGVWMWELDYKESWAQKTWCFWTVVLEKTLESPLDCKEISPGCSLEGLMLKQAPVLWPPDMKSRLIGNDHDAGEYWGQEEKGTTEDEMVGWHHWLNGREFEQTPGSGEGRGSLLCCSPWSSKESDRTEQQHVGSTLWMWRLSWFSPSHVSPCEHMICFRSYTRVWAPRGQLCIMFVCCRIPKTQHTWGLV